MGNLSGAIASVDRPSTISPYNYFVNNDTSFNAFCTLGHNMSVNTGLFNLSYERGSKLLLFSTMKWAMDERPSG